MAGGKPQPDQPSVRMALSIPDHHWPDAIDDDVHSGTDGRHDLVTGLVHGQEHVDHDIGAA